MSVSTRTPRETVELFLRTVTEGSRDDLADLYAEDVRIEIPWSGSGGVPAVTEGRENLRARMKSVEALWSFDEVSGVAVYETIDPAVLIVEYRVAGTLAKNGAGFSLSYVSILTIVDGLIAAARDFNDTAATAELLKELGGLGE